MSEAPFKRCPRCGDDFQHWVESCPDCGCALVHPEAATPGEAADDAELPPASELAALRVGDPWELRRLAERLGAEGVPSRIDSHPPGAPLGGPDVNARGGFYGGAMQLGLYVRPADRARAEAVLHAHMLDEVPDAAAPDEAVDPAGCPACGSPLPSGALECAECGLAFPDAPWHCPACGAEVPADAARCPACGLDPAEAADG